MNKFILLITLSLTSLLSAAKKPNIIYVLMDDMGQGDVSCFNPSSKIHTPHIDSLAANGFGSKAGADTVEYVQQVINDVCKNWGGDKDNLYLSGFSRGAISCGYIGLANDEISKLWKGLIACQHYDGSRWNQSRMNDAIKRAARFKGKAIFQVDNKAEKFQALVANTDPSVKWTWANSGLGNHATTMFLDNRDMMIQLRQWFKDLTTK
ncbi:sulfatase-like hydrolase/transferase [Lentisphaera marina]|uniref:sulfatase-like hydrolase/transferase n=1 Tax=Lentisphaera marina TaxID=1111041 RepID=UPI002366ACAC|nr:sulfatase-like hydrolase/transferase [Lentisphaera marina]MDD7985225.1 sulfatase-like hydrolase/transferase [Lentisphaera marina]